MIFVTVGTHEQQFNRLIKKVDELVADGTITEEVIMQTGYSTYEPKNCKWDKLLPYDEMEKNVKEARIVITHGGPASFMMVLQEKKIPIVVPRQKQFEEHINNHQVEFVKTMSERFKNIIPVLDIEELGGIIRNYSEYCQKMSANGTISNNAVFNKEFEEIVKNLYEI